MLLAIGIDLSILGVILYCCYAPADDLGYTTEALGMMLAALLLFLASPWFIVAGTIGL